MINCTEFNRGASTTNHTTLAEGNVHINFAMCTFSIAVILLGIPGNSLIIHAVRKQKQMQHASNHFIVSLASSNIVALLISVPFSTLNFGHGLCYMPEAVCKILLPTSIFVVIVSVYTHVAIALERRRAIVFPLLPKPSPRRIKFFIAIIWLVPALTMAPFYYHFSKLACGYFCILNFSILNGTVETYTKAFVVTAIVSTLVIPLAVLTWSYQQVIRTLEQNTASIKDLVETNAAVALRLKNQRKVVNCLITLVSAFLALTLPHYLATTLTVFVKTLDHSYFTYTFGVVTLCIHFMLFSLNPIILYCSSTEYRSAFNEAFQCWRIFFCRFFSCFKKSKSLTGGRSKTSCVIALSIVNKRSEGD